MNPQMQWNKEICVVCLYNEKKGQGLIVLNEGGMSGMDLMTVGREAKD